MSSRTLEERRGEREQCCWQCQTQVATQQLSFAAGEMLLVCDACAAAVQASTDSHVLSEPLATPPPSPAVASDGASDPGSGVASGAPPLRLCERIVVVGLPPDARGELGWPSERNEPQVLWSSVGSQAGGDRVRHFAAPRGIKVKIVPKTYSSSAYDQVMMSQVKAFDLRPKL